jgi:SOS-response transcriptional repressor LexA
MHIMTFDDRPDTSKRLEQARIAAGFAEAKSAAAFFGWKYDTYAQHENGTRGISRAAERYARAFKVSLAWLLTGEGNGPLAESDNEGLTKSAVPVGYIGVKGKVAANSWMNVDDMDFGYDDQEHVPSVGNYPIDWQFALKIEGNCLNKIANHGDILVCVDTIASAIDIEPGDLVIVERSRYDGEMVERTAKRVRMTSEGYELWPESTDPQHQAPIKLTGGADGETVRVMGKVLWILRKP